MAIDVAFKLLKILVIKEARNQKIVPQLVSARKETVRVEMMVASS